MSVRFYHNPRCSKSREALALLRRQGVEPEVVEYLRTPPTASDLDRILKLLGIGPRALLRTTEPEYRAAGLDDPGLSRRQLIRAMVEHPKLIERPILVTGRKAVIGRPAEKVLEIL